MTFGAYGKYPFPVSDTLVLFPVAGLDYELNFSEDWYDDLWFRAGLGLDVFFTERLFLRGQALYGISVAVGYADSGIAHGPLIKLGVGWMF